LVKLLLQRSDLPEEQIVVLSKAVVLELEVISDFSDALELGDIGKLFFDGHFSLSNGVEVTRDNIIIFDAVTL